MTVVIVTPRGKVAEALANLLPTPVVVVTATRRYSFFNVIDGAAEQFAFRDPLDGELLTEYRTFPSVAAAHAWVSADADRHANVGRPS